MSDHSHTTPEKGPMLPEKEPTLEKWQVDFLKALEKTGNVSAACRKAKIDRKWAYVKRDQDSFFRELWDEALEIAVEALEEEARRRAKEGVPEYQYFDNGKKRKLVSRKYSDTLLIFLLKAHRPEKYRDNHHHEHVIPPVTVRPDLSKLTVEELRLLRSLTAKASGEAVTGDAGSS